MNLLRGFGLALVVVAVALVVAGGAESIAFPGGDFVGALAVQPNGKIVVAGSVSNGKVLVTRFEANGALDSSFGSSGRVATDVDRWAGSMALDSEGRILVLAPDTCSGTSATDGSTIRSATTASWRCPPGRSGPSRCSPTG